MLYIVIHLFVSVKRLSGLHVRLHLKFTRYGQVPPAYGLTCYSNLSGWFAFGYLESK